MQQCDLVINNKPLADFGGATLRDYSVSAPEIKTYDFQGFNRTSWRLLKQTFGRRTITLTIIFKGPDMDTARLQMSLFNSACWGRVELYLPDGFLYDARANSLGSAALVGDDGDTAAMIRGEYVFTGVQHRPLETVELSAGGGSVFCKSTTPFTDCRLKVTVGADASSYALGGATFANVTAGEVLVFDGIDGLILRDGLNNAVAVNWTDFPSLTPGENAFTVIDAMTVEYYPTFI